MTVKLVEYLIYIPVSVALAIWVGTTLHRNGRRFLLDVFRKDENLADSVNHLLVVGFYLISVGFIALALRESGNPSTATAVIEALATKLGVVLIVLGGMHFLNLFVFTMIRTSQPKPPAAGFVAMPVPVQGPPMPPA